MPSNERAGHLLAAVLANVAALERAYSRAATDIPDDEARWNAEELRLETSSDREVLDGLLKEHHPDPARAVRLANAPGHAVAEVLIKIRLRADPAIHAVADAAALETRAGAIWRAVEAVSRRSGDAQLAETAAMRAEMHEARTKEHLGRIVDAAFWSHEDHRGDQGHQAGGPASTSPTES